MTTREEIIALRNECDEFAEQTLQCKGEFDPDFHTVSDERFYAIAFEDGRKAEREECAKYIENQSLPDSYSEPCLAWFAEDIRARGEVK